METLRLSTGINEKPWAAFLGRKGKKLCYVSSISSGSLLKETVVQRGAASCWWARLNEWRSRSAAGPLVRHVWPRKKTAGVLFWKCKVKYLSRWFTTRWLDNIALINKVNKSFQSRAALSLGILLMATFRRAAFLHSDKERLPGGEAWRGVLLHQCQGAEAKLVDGLARVQRREVRIHLSVVLGDVQTVGVDVLTVVQGWEVQHAP